MTKIIPLGQRILVKVEKPEDKTLGGLYIPIEAQIKPTKGIVIENSEYLEKKISVGAIVLFDKYAGTQVDDNLLVININDILAIEKEELS